VILGRRSFMIGSAALLATPAVAQGRQPVVQTTLGRIRGTREGGLAVFRGIRYGTAARFRAPNAPRVSREIIEAATFGPSAVQRGERYRPQAEDPLYLNIWTPETARGRARPVMVYIHGGAYASGSVADPLNEGRHLAATGDVVVVTINHRLNALGYLYLARLDPRFPDSGNAGQLDLILALKWIRDNIARFGGDPARVMVFGQSGGGAKIATMMGMPAAAGLFHRAATMSGQQVTASGPLNATARARAYMQAVRTGSVDELLSLPTQRLVEGLAATDPIIGGGVYFGPVLDMKWLTRHPFWPDANPQSNAIPMILGNTKDETRGFFGPDHAKLQGLDWSNLAERIAPELRIDIHPEWVVGEYRRLFPSHTPEQVFFAATTAGRSWRGQVEEADARARAGAPTWVYQLDFASPVEPWRGAPHTLDIPLVFGTLDAEGSIAGIGPASRRVSNTMMRLFTTFAHAGAPDADHFLPSWPRYTLPERRTMIFDTNTRVESDPRRAERELFARVPYIQPGT
jgi:para-nitrobenzyl esterase